MILEEVEGKAMAALQYVVKGPSQFLFRVRESEFALKTSAEVALRRVVGRNTIDSGESAIDESGARDKPPKDEEVKIDMSKILI
jgi:hypothetical protein